MPELDLEAVRARRATDPAAVATAAAGRARRALLDHSGRLFVVAADHAARGALGVRDESMAMADRGELLARVACALARPGVDGVLATADILEDLLCLGALEGKVVVGSMNRGGLHGASFEIDDRFTGYDARTIAAMRFDAGKMLCRIDLDDPATPRALEACARSVTALAELGLTAMIEPFLSKRTGGRLANRLGTDDVISSVAVASGLGARSAYTWLKVPVVDGMERVAAATTLPLLLLGGDPHGHPDETYARWQQALALPGVRGLVVGRALLYPPDGDVEAAVDAAAGLVRPA